MGDVAWIFAKLKDKHQYAYTYIGMHFRSG